MLEQDITEHDARRIAGLARKKAERWLMIAEELELTYGLRPVTARLPQPAGPEPGKKITPADIQTFIGGGAKRRKQIAEEFHASIRVIEPLLTREHGIEVNGQGWVKLVKNRSLIAEQLERGAQS